MRKLIFVSVVASCLMSLSVGALAVTPDEFKIEDNPLTNEIIARRGGTSEEDFKAYGNVKTTRIVRPSPMFSLEFRVRRRVVG